MRRDEVAVAVVGAGPYGLSTAAHLKARGAEVRVFGQPMSFWLRMPPSLNLKSFAFATSLSVPHASFTLPAYYRARGLPDLEPCSMPSFAQYGLWVQRTLVPEVEPVDVAQVRGRAGGFELTLANGEVARARRVVVAMGLTGFAHVPGPLRGLPEGRVSHTSAVHDFSAFRGRRVAVLGAGASAIEAATLLHEAGAQATLLVRGPEVVFHDQFDPRRSLRERIRSPNSVLGPGRKSWVLEHFPRAFHFLPESRRVRFVRRYLGPAGPWWIVDRFHGKVDHRLNHEVVGASMRGDAVGLRVLSAGSAQELTVDHVVAGTGYEIDVDRIAFLDPGLRARLRLVERAPSLSRHFESSVPGLYFVGAASAFSFGPLLRFVAGARLAAPVVAAHASTHTRRATARAA